jgi:hypothetical protein
MKRRFSAVQNSVLVEKKHMAVKEVYCFSREIRWNSAAAANGDRISPERRALSPGREPATRSRGALPPALPGESLPHPLRKHFLPVPSSFFALPSRADFLRPARCCDSLQGPT